MGADPSNARNITDHVAFRSRASRPCRRSLAPALSAPLGSFPSSFPAHEERPVNSSDHLVVRTIFTRYLEFGSMGALLVELERQGIKTKINGRRDGRKSGGIRFGVGSLAHLLKNRFYIGEITYRGEAHRGE
jgi:Recombinase